MTAKLLAALNLSLLTVVLILGGPAPAKASESVASMLAGQGLTKAYNPVLLDYLLNEGRRHLSTTQRKKALDQLVTALKKDIEITPAEQKTAALATAGAGLAELFGNSDTKDFGGAADDATYRIWRSWVDSAFTLQRAGYKADANAFFEKCITIYPYADLRGRCAIGLAKGKPAEAYDRLMELTKKSDVDTGRAALRILGRMAGSKGFPADKRQQVVSQLTAMTGGLKKASYGLAACQGLVASGDRSAVPSLQKLSKGMMNKDFYACARSGLLLQFNDHSVVPLLEGQLRGGTFSTNKPYEKIFAAELLMKGGEDAGFRFAESQIGRREKKSIRSRFSRFMKSKDDRADLRPALVASLVRVGGQRAKRVLAAGFSAAPADSWLRTWIAVGMTELGDASHLDLLRRAMNNPDWNFTTVRIATALAKHGDYSGIAALSALYDKARRGIEPSAGKVIAALFGYAPDPRSRKRRLLRLREQIAAALGRIDHRDGVAVLERMLTDPEASVRAGAAYALASMKKSAALPGIKKALEVDYGKNGQHARTPLVQAHLVRAAIKHFPRAAATRKVCTTARHSPYKSVRFLAVAAAKGLSI